MWIIISIVLLNSIGFSIVLPLLPFLVGKYLPSEQVVVGMSLLMSVFSACTFFASPIFFALSDKYGRKSVLIISLLGSVFGYILFGIGGALWVLFTGRIIDGITVGNISILFAYISDSTEPKDRARWFSYMGTVMGIGKIGGPALVGLLGGISLSLAFYVTAGLIFLSTLGVYFLLPESLIREKRSKNVTIANLNVFSQIKQMFHLKTVRVLLTIGVLFYARLCIFQFNFTVFLKDVYSWGPVFIGSILTFISICEIISRALLLPCMLKFVDEKIIGSVGLITLGFGLALIVLSIYLNSILIISLAVFFIIFGEGLFEPVYMGKLSNSVDENRQGQFQGVNQSLQSITNIIVPLGAATVNL